MQVEFVEFAELVELTDAMLDEVSGGSIVVDY